MNIIQKIELSMLMFPELEEAKAFLIAAKEARNEEEFIIMCRAKMPSLAKAMEKFSGVPEPLMEMVAARTDHEVLVIAKDFMEGITEAFSHEI